MHTDRPYTIAQISDLHLSKHNPTSFESFLKVLKLAQSHHPNFLLLTGDLVNDGDQDGYEWLFDKLNQTALPYTCLAGNHDVTLEIGHDLPYEQRQFLPIKKNANLIDCKRFEVGDHQLLCLNSAVSGKEFGRLDGDTLAWLKTTLSQHQNPTLIALHHQPIKVGSKWIDELMLQNGDEFFELLKPFDHIKAIVCGHTHQAHHLHHNGIEIFSTPATARQFLPFVDDFALDTVGAGFRLICLKNNQLHSQVIRLPTEHL